MATRRLWTLVLASMCLLAFASPATAGQRSGQMRVSCYVLPYISLQSDGQDPSYGSSATTITLGAGTIQLVGNTNDPSALQFTVTVASDAAAYVNGMEVKPGQSLNLGTYGYGTPFVLNIASGAPVHVTASR